MSDTDLPSGPEHAFADNAEWSANGSHLEDAAESDRPDAAGIADTTPGAEPVAEPAAEPPADDAPADDGSAFLTDLVRAMQTTATAERTRLAEDTDRRRDAHLAAVETRREAEATTMRELADADLHAIDAWAEEERRSIQAERERRATVLQADLATSLAEHGTNINHEIEGVEAAIAAYRAEVDTFFATLDHETDPVAIARHASQRPVFPSLNAVAGSAEDTATDAVTASEPSPDEAASGDFPSTGQTSSTDDSAAPVGVMEPRGSADLAASWAAWSGAGAEPTTTSELASDVADQAADLPEDDLAEPAPLPVSAVVSGHGRLLQSIPASRPLSWLRRDHDAGEPPDGQR